MSTETTGWILAVLLVGLAFTGALFRLKTVLERMEARFMLTLEQRETRIMAAIAGKPVPVFCTLSGRPIEQCPPEHRHFPRPAPVAGFPFRGPAPVPAPEQTAQVARTPHRPATAPPAPKPRRAAAPVQHKEARGSHWKSDAAHDTATHPVVTEEEATS